MVNKGIFSIAAIFENYGAITCAYRNSTITCSDINMIRESRCSGGSAGLQGSRLSPHEFLLVKRHAPLLESSAQVRTEHCLVKRRHPYEVGVSSSKNRILIVTEIVKSTLAEVNVWLERAPATIYQLLVGRTVEAGSVLPT